MNNFQQKKTIPMFAKSINTRIVLILIKAYYDI